jgi:hypothetical protein
MPLVMGRRGWRCKGWRATQRVAGLANMGGCVACGRIQPTVATVLCSCSGCGGRWPGECHGIAYLGPSRRDRASCPGTGIADGPAAGPAAGLTNGLTNGASSWGTTRCCSCTPKPRPGRATREKRELPRARHAPGRNGNGGERSALRCQHARGHFRRSPRRRAQAWVERCPTQAFLPCQRGHARKAGAPRRQKGSGGYAGAGSA